MKRRAFLSTLIAPAIARADFTIPAADWGKSKQRAIVFGADNCKPCRDLKRAADAGRWDAAWTFHIEGTEAYRKALAKWNKRARFIIAEFPTIYFPDAGPLGCLVEGYKPETITAVLDGTWKRVRASTQRATGYYPTDNRRWQLYPVETRTTLINHLIRNSNHRSANLSLAWLNTLSLAELDGLHSDLHDRRVRWQYVTKTLSRSKTYSRRG